MGTSSGQEDEKEATVDVTVQKANGEISSEVVRIGSQDLSAVKVTRGPGYIIVEHVASSSRAVIIQGKSVDEEKT